MLTNSDLLVEDQYMELPFGSLPRLTDYAKLNKLNLDVKWKHRPGFLVAKMRINTLTFKRLFIFMNEELVNN